MMHWERNSSRIAFSGPNQLATFASIRNLRMVVRWVVRSVSQDGWVIDNIRWTDDEGASKCFDIPNPNSLVPRPGDDFLPELCQSLATPNAYG